MVLETPQNFIYDRGEVDLLIISGPDSDDFLNRLSTLNFKKKITGTVHGAFLNGQAKLISLFSAWKDGDRNFLFIEKEMFEKTKLYLEKMHFSEDLKIETKKYFCIEARGSHDFPSEDKADSYNWGIPGKYYFSNLRQSVNSISESQYDLIRAEFGFPKPLKDLTEDHILIEGPMDDFLDRNKGCYPGQEVIEKIYTYGRVAKKIKKVIFENATSEDFKYLVKNLPKNIEVEGQSVGFLSSVYQGSKNFGIVTLKRHFYEKNHSFEIPLVNSKILRGSIDQTSPIA